SRNRDCTLGAARLRGKTLAQQARLSASVAGAALNARVLSSGGDCRASAVQYALLMATDDLDAAPVAAAACGLAVPVIDLGAPHARVVAEIAQACAQWGFFQVVGHGV